MKLLLPLLLALAGCRALDPALLTAPPAGAAARLPALATEVRIERLTRINQRSRRDSLLVARDLDTLAARTLRQALGAPTVAADPAGYAELTVRRVAYSEGVGYSVATAFSFGLLTLINWPWSRYRCTVDVYLDVRNRRHELLGSYYAQGQADHAAGLYRPHYGERTRLRLVHLQSTRQALAAVQAQLTADLPRLQAGLAR